MTANQNTAIAAAGSFIVTAIKYAVPSSSIPNTAMGIFVRGGRSPVFSERSSSIGLEKNSCRREFTSMSTKITANSISDAMTETMSTVNVYVMPPRSIFTASISASFENSIPMPSPSTSDMR